MHGVTIILTIIFIAAAIVDTPDDNLFIASKAVAAAAWIGAMAGIWILYNRKKKGARR